MGVTAIIKPEFTEDDKEQDGADKTEPMLPDGGDGEEIEAEFIPDETKITCTWSTDPDEHRRVFIFDKMADADIAGNTLVENMETVCQWLKNGTVPTKKPKLHQVKQSKED